MPRLTLTEQTRLAKLRVDRSYRAANARLQRSTLLKWRFGPPLAERLLLVPVELRAADPSFASEVEFGHFGLGGTLHLCADASPFDAVGADPAWTRALHGFDWLRHLGAAGHDGARDLAIDWVADWCGRHPHPTGGIPWEPAVVGRRIMSWMANASLILDRVDQDDYDLITDHLADQLIHLSATWRDAPAGLPRLQALTAVMMGHLCIAGHDRSIDATGQAFAIELGLQILPDGGHISRNPAALIELLLDFLPVRQCFVTRERAQPATLDTSVRRMLKMLRYLRRGDGEVARFNGVSAHSVDALATVLAYDDPSEAALAAAPQSKFARLERGGTVLVIDVGQPPPLEVSGDAHAGCLSFEMSARNQAIFVNCGAPAAAASQWQAHARATSSHNTLCLGGKSSARLVRDDRFEALIGGMPIRYPEGVEAGIVVRNGGIELDAFHDGYYFRYKMLHLRRIELSADGATVTGIDRLGPQRGQLRLAQDVPFAIHFHIDGRVDCAPGDDIQSARLTLRDGQIWRFFCEAAALSIEESMNYADLAGPSTTLQIVLRAATFGESEVKWTMERES